MKIVVAVLVGLVGATAVEDVGCGSGEEAEEEDGEGGRGLHEGDEQRGGGEDRHEPSAGGVLHPGADGGDGGGDPTVAEERDAGGAKPEVEVGVVDSAAGAVLGEERGTWVSLRGPTYSRRIALRYAVSMAEPTMVLTLVHGTFASEADWVKEGSILRRTLAGQRGATVVFRSCRWSGGNTHAQRLDDAELLRCDLHKALAEFPNGKHFVLAHSHGGNLALYALRDRVLQSQLAGVVTMGTPFLHCTQREVETPASIIKWTLSIFGVFAMIVFWAILTSSDWANSIESRLDAWNKVCLRLFPLPA